MKKTLIAVSLTALIMSTLFFGVAATTSSDLNGVVAKLGSMVTSLNGIRTDIQNLGTTMGGAAQSVREPFSVQIHENTSYTVPAGKKATVEMISVLVIGVGDPDATEHLSGTIIWESDGQTGTFGYTSDAYARGTTQVLAADTFYPVGISISGGGSISYGDFSSTLAALAGGFPEYTVAGYLEDL